MTLVHFNSFFFKNNVFRNLFEGKSIRMANFHIIMAVFIYCQQFVLFFIFNKKNYIKSN